MNISNTKLASILQALMVTFLWSTSFIIVKIGLIDIPPVTFAGLRYFLAAVCFIPIVVRDRYKCEIMNIKRKDFLKIILLGVVFYTFTQGFQFIGLSLLPPVTVSLMLNFTPLAVTMLGVLFIREIPTKIQWTGIILFLSGVMIYFYPISGISNQSKGLIVMGIAVFFNAVSAILGRSINKRRNISPVTVTFISMGIGSLIMLFIGIITETFVVLSVKNWLLLIWLSVVNTAFAFTLWNTSLQTLSAIESSIINGTMLVQIALMARLFFGESITPEKGAGMIIAAAGAVIVQIRKEGNNGKKGKSEYSRSGS